MKTLVQSLIMLIHLLGLAQTNLVQKPQMIDQRENLDQEKEEKTRKKGRKGSQPLNQVYLFFLSLYLFIFLF